MVYRKCIPGWSLHQRYAAREATPNVHDADTIDAREDSLDSPVSSPPATPRSSPDSLGYDEGNEADHEGSVCSPAPWKKRGREEEVEVKKEEIDELASDQEEETPTKKICHPTLLLIWRHEGVEVHDASYGWTAGSDDEEDFGCRPPLRLRRKLIKGIIGSSNFWLQPTQAGDLVRKL